MPTRHLRPIRTRLRAAALVACATLALLCAACAEDDADADEPLVLELDAKARVTIDAEIGTAAIPRTGLQQVWVNRSSGWDPCPEMLSTEFPPETCWIRVLIGETPVAVLLPEPNGTLGPYPIPVHFDVFDFAAGDYQLWLIQVGRLEVRHTEGAPLLIVPAPEPTPTAATQDAGSGG
ncbi:MAG: hypothetical protein OXG17_03700 [Chloroflexi bacterium]|nr:hypothetical protein [Chloroflexota bacterium]